MIEREVAWRVFAHEFNHADYFFHEGDERSPNYLVTPTGARINRLYFVGVLTEIDNLGTEDDMWRARVSDPTGAFTIYAGQYQPEAAVFFSEQEIPSFISIIGKARIYKPEEGAIYTSVRPEELNSTDAGIRDRWIVDTARLSFERIMLVNSAIRSDLKGKELTDMLVQSGAGGELANGISIAVEHYVYLEKYLDTLTTAIVDALKTLLPDGYQAYIKSDTSIAHKTDTDEIVYELMCKLDHGKGVRLVEMKREAKNIGLAENQVDEAVKTLMIKGRCYEPRIDVLRRV
jgi:RPA family protein